MQSTIGKKNQKKMQQNFGKSEMEKDKANYESKLMTKFNTL